MTPAHLETTKQEGTGPLKVILEVPNRDALTELRTVINEFGSEIKKVETEIHLDDRVKQVDIGVLTEKQREAAEVAIFVGYYQQPRETKLGPLADYFGISKSAMSQRLRAAEANLVRSMQSD